MSTEKNKNLKLYVQYDCNYIFKNEIYLMNGEKALRKYTEKSTVVCYQIFCDVIVVL